MHSRKRRVLSHRTTLIGCLCRPRQESATARLVIAVSCPLVVVIAACGRVARDDNITCKSISILGANGIPVIEARGDAGGGSLVLSSMNGSRRMSLTFDAHDAAMVVIEDRGDDGEFKSRYRLDVSDDSVTERLVFEESLSSLIFKCDSKTQSMELMNRNSVNDTLPTASAIRNSDRRASILLLERESSVTLRAEDGASYLEAASIKRGATRVDSP